MEAVFFYSQMSAAVELTFPFYSQIIFESF